jgi:hypothetical protein
LITEYRIFPKDSINIILSTVSTRIRIIQIAAHAVIIPVERQWLCQAAQAAVLGEEDRCYHTVIPCSQILALDIRIVGLSVVGVFVLILRSTEGDLSGDAVTVGLVDLSLFIGDAGDTSSGIVDVVAGAAIEALKGDPVESAVYLRSVDIRGIRLTIDVLLDQYRGMLTVDVV